MPAIRSTFKIVSRLVLMLIVALVAPMGAAARQDELAAVRQATARFHDVDAAIAAGYQLGYVNGAGVRIITGCVAHPTAGAMGYHYFSKQLIDDNVIDVLRPEGLVYSPGPDGKLQLAAVEYVVPGAFSNPSGVETGALRIGMPVSAVFEDITDDVTLLKFRPKD